MRSFRIAGAQALRTGCGVIVEELELLDFRNYRAARFVLTSGITAVLGDNGQGKTNFAEALGFLATLDSFRGAPNDALVRSGAEAAVVRARIVDDDGRIVTVEAEIPASGRHRVMVNRQRLARARELLGVMRVTVFSPDDLVLIKGAPGDRRRFLDDALVSLAVRHDATRLELDRILRQRNQLLKQAGGRRADADTLFTLDVWDAKFAETGEQLGRARQALLERCAPLAAAAYADLAGSPVPVTLDLVAPWRPIGLAAALAAARDDDLRRGVSTVGPHRDDVSITLAGLPARTHASQGEQRTLALSLRLAVHRLVAERTGSIPVLVLDDVLSELDPSRARALLANVPPGQVVITSAAGLPDAAPADRVLIIEQGTVRTIER